MTKKHIISSIFTTLILVSCGKPTANNNYIAPQQINEPQIAEITPTFETQIERVNNCDGTNSTYNVSYKTIQTQKATFEVTVGAGGLVTGTPVPSALEVQLEAKITAALAKDYGLTTEKGHDIKLNNPLGTYLEHTIEWKVTRVKGLIEVVYGDGVAQVVFDKIANVELYNRTSKSLGCEGNNESVLPTSTSSGEALIATLETQPPISSYGLKSCSAFENGETRQVLVGIFVIGDIIIDGTKQYDEGGTGESTVAYFEKESTVLAQWGAGCKQGSKNLAEQVIKEQFDEGYTSVRFVLVQSDGQQKVQYYNNQDPISTCPSAPGHLEAGKGFTVTLQKGCHYHFNVACSGCSANVEDNYIIYYNGESGDMVSVTVPEGSVWRYDRVPTPGEVCEAQDFYPTELPAFLNLNGVQLLNICS